jgi:hypothetical protein
MAVNEGQVERRGGSCWWRERKMKKENGEF